MSSNSLAEEITPKIFKFSFKDFQEKYNKPCLCSYHTDSTRYRETTMLEAANHLITCLFSFLVKNWSHKYWLAWGYDDTSVFYSAFLMGLGWSSLTQNIRIWYSKSWISNSKNSKPCFICLSYRHVLTTWQQKSLQSISYFSFKDFKKVRNFSFMKLKLEKLVDAVRKTFTHLSPQ